MTDQGLDIPPAFITAAEQFNAHQYWECHETLEALWLPATEPLKTFLQGIIQAAAGFLHVERCNYKGAISLLSQALDKLHRTENDVQFHHWMNVFEFITDIELAYNEVECLGPSNLNHFCSSQYPVISINEYNQRVKSEKVI